MLERTVAISCGLSFLPIPSALLILGAESGERMSLPVGWVGVVCGPPNLITVWLHAQAVDRGGLRLGSPFTLELPAEEALRSSSGGLSPGRPAADSVSGKTPIFSFSGAPEGYLSVGESSVQFECRCRSLSTRFGQYRLCGEIGAVYLAGCCQEMTAALDLCRWLSLPKRKHSCGREMGVSGEVC